MHLPDPNPFLLTYHCIDSRFHLGLNFIHPEKFKRHIEFIASFNQISEFSKQIKIAFDDGYESVYSYAFPVMEKYGLKGIVFPVSAYLGRYNDWDINFKINRTRHLNKEQLQTLSNAGWEVGSHGHNHVAYDKLSQNEICQDLIDSKNCLEDIIGKGIQAFCPPFGALPKYTLPLIQDAGFQHLFLQKPLFKKKIKAGKLTINYTRSVYSIDSFKRLKQKFLNWNSELIKENLIHSLSRATVIAKEIL